MNRRSFIGSSLASIVALVALGSLPKPKPELMLVENAWGYMVVTIDGAEVDARTAWLHSHPEWHDGINRDHDGRYWFKGSAS